MEPIRPPGRLDASSRATSAPNWLRRYAHDRPEIPPPMTMTCLEPGIVSCLERLGKEGTLIHLLRVQIAIESHSDVANENSSERCDANVAGRENDEAFLTRGFQAEQLRSKGFVEGDAKFGFHFVFGHYCVAKQAANYGAAQNVVSRKAVAAHSGNAARGDRGFISG